MNLADILACIATGLSLFAALLTFLIKFVRTEKAKKFLQNTLKITDALQPLIIGAEQFVHYTGAEKKEYVLTKANQFALENSIKFDKEKVSELIDELVATTKKVNSREKDKTKSIVVNQGLIAYENKDNNQNVIKEGDRLDSSSTII